MLFEDTSKNKSESVSLVSSLLGASENERKKLNNYNDMDQLYCFERKNVDPGLL